MTGNIDAGPLSPRCDTSACTLDGWGSSEGVCRLPEAFPRLLPPVATQQIHRRGIIASPFSLARVTKNFSACEVWAAVAVALS